MKNDKVVIITLKIENIFDIEFHQKQKKSIFFEKKIGLKRQEDEIK